MNVHTARIRLMRVAPHHGVMPHYAATRMVERAKDGVTRVVANVQMRAQPFNFFRKDDARFDALQPVDFGAAAHCAQRAIIVRQRQVPALAEHNVNVQLAGHTLVKFQAGVIEAHPLRGEIVAAHNCGVAPASARADVAFFQHGHISDSVLLREVICTAQPVRTAADNDRIVALSQLMSAPHARWRPFPAQRLPHQFH